MKDHIPARCPYCHGKARYYFGIRSSIYNHCLECDLIYRVNAQGSDVKVRKYYEESYYDQYTTDQEGGHRQCLNSHILDLIETRKRTGRILDVGMGLGFFLNDAQKRGWQIYGIEPSKKSSEMAMELLGKKVFTGTLKEYKENGNFDVITFINALDHSVEPWREIEYARSQMKPQGLIYLRFPNGLIHTLIYRLALKFKMTNLISKYLVFHEYCITVKYIKKILKDFGFEGIEIANSRPSGGDPHKLFQNEFYTRSIKKIMYAINSIVYILSIKKIILGVSIEVIAFKK